ncbi:MAG: hypothetical protein NTY59_11925 [Alphaproteobacteria bacterium]|nr:hypothetical protein [Alphaproteobacteria bacterium]
MRWLIDLFKEIPLSVVLREQLRAARAEIERLRARRPTHAVGDYDPLESS